MNKEEKKIVETYYREYEIDLRTMPMIVHHYIDCGERQIAQLTREYIEKYYNALLKEEAEREKEGKISLISPEFNKYLLTACMGLYKLEPTIRYKLIKEWLR